MGERGIPVTRRAAVAAGVGALSPRAGAQSGATIVLDKSEVLGGGVVRGLAWPGANLTCPSGPFQASPRGRFLVPIARDASGAFTIAAVDRAARSEVRLLPRTYETSIVRGLPKATSGFEGETIDDPVSVLSEGSGASAAAALAPAQAKLVKAEQRVKAQAWRSMAGGDGFDTSFAAPLAGPSRVTSPWGAVRIKEYLDGRRVQAIHLGIDYGRPTSGAPLLGTNVVAPAPGVVALAGRDFYFEGNCVFLAHGQGLVTVYLHMRALAVNDGQVVSAGQKLGEVGAAGSATAPHLCWRARCRGVDIDPTLL
jgi:murein DD-endopeptidase MepM/ murein hydrolase activator NlpD